LDDLDQTSLARELRGGLESWEAELAQTGFRDDGQKVGPVEGRLLVESDAEEPVGGRMGAQHRDGEAIDGHAVVGGIEGRGESSAWCGAFDVIVESERLGVLQDEMGRRAHGPEGQ